MSIKNCVKKRSFETKGNTIYINNMPICLKMILNQGYYGEGHLTATEEELLKDVQLIKEMGFNGVRIHEKIEHETFLYYCDVLGLLVWTEMPSTYEFADQTMEKVAEEWVKIIRQNYNHPSVMTWVIMNESWGVMDIANNKIQQDYTIGLYHLTKALDPTRFAISNDGWEHTKSDLITLHNYAEKYEDLRNCYMDMEEKLLKSKQTSSFHPKAPFSNGFQYDGQPIILSEFGGISFAADLEKGWGYGKSVRDEAEYIEKLSAQMRAIKENPSFSGYCLTQFTDVQQEVNGLVRENREPKISIDKIRKLNEEMR